MTISRWQALSENIRIPNILKVHVAKQSTTESLIWPLHHNLQTRLRGQEIAAPPPTPRRIILQDTLPGLMLRPLLGVRIHSFLGQVSPPLVGF